jgi:hypothetical protein
MGLTICGMKVNNRKGKVRSECEKDEGTDCEDEDHDTNWYK